MKFLLSLSVAAGALLGASSAFAAPTLQTISVSPSAAGLSASAPDFSFNGIRTSDFSTINLTSTGGGISALQSTGFCQSRRLIQATSRPPASMPLAGTACIWRSPGRARFRLRPVAT
jgi:hypothetical protein